MTKSQKIGFVIAIPIAIACAVLNFTTDYIHKYIILDILMVASFLYVIGFLYEVAKGSKKGKDSNQGTAADES